MLIPARTTHGLGFQRVTGYALRETNRGFVKRIRPGATGRRRIVYGYSWHERTPRHHVIERNAEGILTGTVGGRLVTSSAVVKLVDQNGPLRG